LPRRDRRHALNRHSENQQCEREDAWEFSKH
jgi:hypothetical protein